MAVQPFRAAAPGPVAEPRPVAFLAPLAVRPFRTAWAGLVCGHVGDQAQVVVLAIVALDLLGTASGWGTVLAAQAVPQVLLLLLGGLAADRVRATAILRAADGLQALTLAALALLAATGRLAPSHLYAAALAFGVLGAFAQPAAGTLVPALLPPGLVRRGNAARSLALNVARLLGPPLATSLLAAFGAAAAMAGAGAAFLAAAVLFGRTPLPPTARRPDEPPLRRLRAGLAAARRDAVVGVPIVMVSVFSLGYAGAALVGLPTLARVALGAGDGGIGVLFGAVGAGALVGALAAGTLPAVRRLGLFACGTVAGVGLGLAGAGLAPTLWSAAACLALSGLCISSAAVALLTLVQTRAPEEVRGRVMALFSLGLTGLNPLSYALAGALGDAVGPRGVLLLGGGCVVLAGAAGLLRRAMREATGPDAGA